MAVEKRVITKSEKKSYEKKLSELDYELKNEINKRIGEAREQGDLSENAEYTAAMEEQGKINDEILQIKEILNNSVLIDDPVGSDFIQLGSKFRLLDVSLDEENDMELVSSIGANSLEGKISNDAPLGQALLGAKAGETVKVTTDFGVFEYKVLELLNDEE